MKDMKLYKVLFAVAVSVAFAACAKMDEVLPEGGTMLASQVQATNAAIPSRASASFNGMFTNIGLPAKMYTTPDDWEFLTWKVPTSVCLTAVTTGSPFAVSILPVTIPIVTRPSVIVLLIT